MLWWWLLLTVVDINHQFNRYREFDWIRWIYMNFWKMAAFGRFSSFDAQFPAFLSNVLKYFVYSNSLFNIFYVQNNISTTFTRKFINIDAIDDLIWIFKDGQLIETCRLLTLLAFLTIDIIFRNTRFAQILLLKFFINIKISQLPFHKIS